eukprot:TRINITY_DN1223_c0_g1_i2.p2 TRINITY_DN1223_c0_g1~~TRINITY_DN1223_c0_g1_i2.p2  ORF type:complete len:230 (+),score=-3.87 TRINITY_DN1223_c0_g1_i2:102-692(+)
MRQINLYCMFILCSVVLVVFSTGNSRSLKIVSSASGLNNDDNDKQESFSELQTYYGAWRDLNVESYRFDLTIYCLHCIEPLNIVQRSNVICQRVVQEQLQSNNQDLDLLSVIYPDLYDLSEKLTTVEALFNYSNTLYYERTDFDQLSITFDQDYHFPLIIESKTYIVKSDTGGNPQIIGPSSYYFQVSDFQVNICV